MFLFVLPCLILVVLGGSAAVLLTSKKLAEKFVTAGLLPRTFLGIIPALQTISRVFGGLLIVAGTVKIAIDSGWIDAHMISRYAFPACLILIGVMMMLLNRRD